MNREKYQSDPEWRERKKVTNKLSLYGITLEEYSALDQSCYTCGTTEDLAIDHCHESGKIRGRLCRKCNTALGLLREDPNIMLKMIEYIGAVK